MFNFPKYSKDWFNLSSLCKKRDNYKCVRCRRASTPNNRLHAHHIISKSKGGRDELSNLRTLCRECHELRHSHMRKNNKVKREVLNYGKKKIEVGQFSIRCANL